MEQSKVQEKKEQRKKIQPINKDNIANLSIVFSTSNSFQKAPLKFKNYQAEPTEKVIEVNALEFAESKPNLKTARKGKRKLQTKVILFSDDED